MHHIYLTYLLYRIARQVVLCVVVFFNFSYSKQHQDKHPCIHILTQLSIYLLGTESQKWNC